MQDHEFTPKGTWAFALLFLVLLVLIWGSIYYLLISQGPTT